MRNAVWGLLSAYNRLADAIRNGTVGIEYALKRESYGEIQQHVDRIKEAFDGHIPASDAITDDPARSEDDSEA